MNYEFTGETKEIKGITLHRIRATKDIKGGGVKAGDLGGWIEKESNLSDDAWVADDACVYGRARVSGDATIESESDYSVFKNTWSSGRWFTYTKSNKMWNVGCFYGTGEDLIAKAYKDSYMSGRCYEIVVRAQEALEKAVN